MKLKSNPFLRSAILAASILLCFGSSANAGTLYWDANGVTTGAGTTPTGNWLTSNFWSATSNGTGTPGAWVADSDAVFSAGTDATGSATITITSPSNVSAASLTFEEGTISIGGASNNNLTLTGAGGNITVNSGATAEIGNGTTLNLAGTVGVTKLGAGTLSLKPFDATTFTGGLRVNGGKVVIDFANLTPTTAADIVANTNTLSLAGATLEVKQRSGAGYKNSQTFASTTLNAGDSSLVATLLNSTSGGGIVVDLKAITRNSGGVLNFTNPTGTLSTTNSIKTSTGTASTILTDSGVAYATVGGNDWAAKDSGNAWVVGLSSLSGFTASTASTLSGNADVATGVNTTLSADSSITTLRFNQAEARSITLVPGFTLTTGGILVTNTVGNNLSNITGGTLRSAATAAGKDLVVINNNTANSLKIDSVIADAAAGSTGLTKSGAGSVVLTGTNTYQGATVIGSGTLQIGDGTIDGSIANTSGITTNGTLLLNLAADQNYSVGITGTGGISKTGAGILTLSGSNSYSGTTSILTGTVKAGSTQGLGTNSAISLANAAGVMLDLNGNNISIRSLAGGGANGGTVALGSANLTINNGSSLTYNGDLSGSGSLLLTTGQLTLAKASPDYTGNVTLSSGAILITAANKPNVLGSNTAGTQSVTVESGATFSVGAGNNAASQLQNIVINGTGASGQQAALVSSGMGFGSNQIRGIAVATDANIFVNSNGAADQRGLNAQGALAGSGTLTITGGTNSGFLSLAAATGSVAGYSSFTGNVNVRSTSTDALNAAGLISNNATALGTTANIDLGSNTYFTLGASQTIGGLSSGISPTIAPRVSLAGNTLTIGSTNLDSTFSGVISGSGSITKAGSGSLTLTNANTYTGTTTVNAGILKAGNATAFGLAANAKLAFGPSSTGTAQLAGNSMTVIALSSDANVGTPVLENANAAPVVLTVNNSSASTYAGVLRDGTGGGSLGLAKLGSSILTLSGNNGYTGTTVIGGTAGGVIVTANNGLGTIAGNTTVAAGTSLGFSGGVNYSTAETIIGSGQGTAAGGAFTNTSRGFIQSVSNNNTFAGAIEINATGLTRIGVQNGSQLTLTGPITMASGVTGVQMLFRGGQNNGDFITLSNNANSWDTDTQIFSDNVGTGAGLRLGINDALPTNVSVKISGSGSGSGAMLDLAGYNQKLNGLVSNSLSLKISNSSSTTSTLTLHTLANQNTSSGTVIQDGVGKIAVVKTGSFNQIIQTASTYTGGTWIKQGSITLQSGNDRLATSGSVVLGDTTTTGKLVLGESGTARNQTLAGLTTSGLGGSVVGAAPVNSLLALNIASGTNTFSGVLGGGSGNENKLALTKSGNGILELTNTNTYSGDTTITAGSLALNGSGSIDNSALIDVKSTGILSIVGVTTSTTIGSASAQTLKGLGSVDLGTKTMTIGGSGTLAPGASPGTLQFIASAGGKLDFAVDSTIAFELGTISDLIAFDSAGDWLTGSGNATLSLSLLSGFNYASTYTIFENVTTAGFTMASITGYDTGTYSANFEQSGDNYNLSFTAIPEPNVAALLGGLGTLLLLRRRRVS